MAYVKVKKKDQNFNAFPQTDEFCLFVILMPYF